MKRPPAVCSAGWSSWSREAAPKPERSVIGVRGRWRIPPGRRRRMLGVLDEGFSPATLRGVPRLLSLSRRLIPP